MSKPGRIPIRLLAESLVIVAGVEVAVLAVLPWLAAPRHGAAAMAVHALALVLLAAPLLYWRGMAAVRQLLQLRAAAVPAGALPLTLQSHEQRRRRAVAMTAAAQCVGIAVTAAIVSYMKLQIDDDMHQRFDRHVERLEAEVLRRFNQPVSSLKDARSAHQASMAVGRSQFQRYVASRNLLQELPGVRAFGLVQRVERSDLARFTEAEQTDGAPNFQPRDGGTAATLFVVKHIEPLASNAQAWGMDLGADPLMHQAIERAVASGQPTLARDGGMLQGGEPAPGFVVLVPLYGPASEPGTAELRRAALSGLLFAPLSTAGLLDGVTTAAADGMLDFELFDGDGTLASQLVFDADAHLSAAQGAIAAHSYQGRLLHTSRSLTIGGRVLTLRTSTLAAFEASVDRRPLLYVALGGALLSLLLALVVWALASGRIRAQSLAERMTADLERLAQVVRHTSNAVTITDPQLRITWVNEGFTRISGYDLAAALGRTPGELLGSGKADPAVLQQVADAAAAGRGCRVEILNRARDGREYWIDTEVQPLRDAQGHLTGFMEIGSDITDKRRASEALTAATEGLQEKEHLMRLVTDNMPGRIAYWDARLLLRFGNAAFFKRFGAAAGSLGQPAAQVLGERFRNGALMAAAAQGRAQSIEREELGSDGTPVQTLTHMIPDMREDRVCGFVALTLDITAAKRTEAQLRSTNHELTLARDHAEQASVAKSQFLANISHEIRTPMNAVLGMLKLLHNTPLTPRQRDYAGKAEGAARALLGLLNDILDSSKIEAGKLALDPRPFQLRRLMDDLSVILSANLGAKLVELRFDIAAQVPVALVGDDLRLLQILVNLGGNAIKFTPLGEVVVAVQLLALNDGVARLAFSVRDTGIGIPPEQQQHIFKAFSQAEASTTRRFGGTGLGLSICQHLVGLMGSGISLQSTPEVGSCFSFELDLALAPEAPVALPSPRNAGAMGEAGPCSAGPRLAGLRLLVVEDNANNQQVARELLEAEGAQVHLAADGEQGVAAVTAAVTEANPAFDAVLMDLQMPVMDGYTAARQIRLLPGRARLPIIAMTANATAIDRDASLAAGMNGHIGKPFDLDQLVATLLRHVRPDAARPVAPRRTTAAPAILPSALADSFQQQGLDLAAAVRRLGGRSEVWLRSAASFAQELPTVARDLGRLLAQQRHAEAARLMHTLKGMSATLGATQLAARAAEAESALGRAAEGGTPALQIDDLAQAITQGGRLLQAAVEQLGAAQAGTAAEAPMATHDPAALQALLQPLAVLLRASDMAATDAFAALQATQPAAWGPALQPLGEAMARLDFERAAQLCDQLIAALPDPKRASRAHPFPVI
ncbi:CHASE domain-containing protein [Aquabacterium sp.]|uniref:CHASE domain-containing protein n=1 Tax=Aquabacterium sp. TaxID=1872578 RepID=UPI002CB30056|nr:CHASE domain-containing protein [Aquabacterium sp.]HSW08388.1 CHASE domain-containing protein [Aquabacterium sp.]